MDQSQALILESQDKGEKRNVKCVDVYIMLPKPTSTNLEMKQ
jgi:hypothetical protein